MKSIDLYLALQQLISYIYICVIYTNLFGIFELHTDAENNIILFSLFWLAQMLFMLTACQLGLGLLTNLDLTLLLRSAFLYNYINYHLQTHLQTFNADYISIRPTFPRGQTMPNIPIRRCITSANDIYM